MKKEIFELNGYRCILRPDHPRAMKGSGYEGYVYEHVYLAEKMIGRPLTDNEIVHHLDNNRGNNRYTNLLVILESQHAKLHCWLDSGAPGLIPETPLHKPKFCESCGLTLQFKQLRFCSCDCSASTRVSQRRPGRNELVFDIENMSWEAIGRKYGVTGNAVKKWARAYQIRFGARRCPDKCSPTYEQDKLKRAKYKVNEQQDSPA